MFSIIIILCHDKTISMKMFYSNNNNDELQTFTERLSLEFNGVKCDRKNIFPVGSLLSTFHRTALWSENLKIANRDCPVFVQQICLQSIHIQLDLK